jgi:hypothetical protein
MGLTVQEAKLVTGQARAPKPKAKGPSADEMLEAAEDARELYELHDGHTDSADERAIFAIVEKHIKNKTIGLLDNIYYRTHKKREPDKPMSLRQMLNYEGSGTGGSEALRRLAAVVEQALSRETRGSKYRGK